MPDYSEEFKKFTSSMSGVRPIIAENHRHHYPVLETLFGFHYWLHNLINPTYRELGDEWLSGSQIIHVLFMNNFSVAYGVLQAFESNSLIAISPLLRNILDTVVKMEYLASNPDERNNMIYADAVAGIKKQNRRKVIAEVRDDYTEEECDEQVILDRINGGYHFKWYIEKLDRGPNQDVGAYKHFSQLTHSSMDKMYQQLAWMHSHKSSNLLCSNISNYDYEILDTVPQHLESLLLFNILAELRGHENLIKRDNFPFSESMSFLEGLRHESLYGKEFQELIDGGIRFMKSFRHSQPDPS